MKNERVHQRCPDEEDKYETDGIVFKPVLDNKIVSKVGLVYLAYPVGRAGVEEGPGDEVFGDDQKLVNA